MKKTIDCFGYLKTSVDYFNRRPDAVDIVTSGNYTYIRYTTDANCAIWRIDSSVSGTTAIRWAYGAWANRASLTYDHHLNESMDIDA